MLWAQNGPRPLRNKAIILITSGDQIDLNFGCGSVHKEGGPASMDPNNIILLMVTHEKGSLIHETL